MRMDSAFHAQTTDREKVDFGVCIRYVDWACLTSWDVFDDGLFVYDDTGVTQAQKNDAQRRERVMCICFLILGLSFDTTLSVFFIYGSYGMIVSICLYICLFY